MLYRIYYAFRGTCAIHIQSRLPLRVLNVLMQNGIRFFGIRHSGNTELYFRIGKQYEKDFRALAKTHEAFAGVTTEIRPLGFPCLWGKACKRWGLLVGMALGIFFLYLSTFFLWSVTIDADTEVLSDTQLYAALDEIGVRVGMPVWALDEKKMQTAFLARRPEYVFAAFNRQGTDLVLQLRARIPPPEIENEGEPCHIVASAGGVIVSVDAPNGEALVRAGDVVNAGDLLVSGALSMKNGGYRIVHSEAQIYARTYESFRVSIPLKEQALVLTGEERKKSALHLLGLDLTLFDVRKSPYDSCTAQESLTQLSLWGYSLPLYRHTVFYAQTEETQLTRSAARAEELGYDAYRAYLKELLQPAGVLENETITLECNGEELVFSAELLVVRNIALERPFTFDDLQNPNKISEMDVKD